MTQSIRARLEPDSEPPPRSVIDATEAAISIAISLKRIADRFEAITTIHGESPLGQINVGVEGNIDVRNNY
jgi:hypothetical protein